MSKVDAMRAMREARFAGGPKPASAPAAKPAPKPTSRSSGATPPAAAAAPSEAPDGGQQLCGHRNMSGRSCTREAAHQATGTKNHRYG